MSENLHIAITGDNQNFLNALSQARENVRRTADTVEKSGMSIEDMFKRIGAAAGIAFSLAGAKEFVNKVAQVRGEFQQLEIAFTTMLGSGAKANSLMQQLVHTAAITPFDLKGVADGAKQLLAYGTAAEDVNETITRLGDIAAGLSIPLGDLVYLYGTTMTQGQMFTQDLRQFMGRGIPMAEELAKQFGVTKDKVSELFTAGKVGAEEVKTAIWNMTNEGSKFGGLMEAQSKSITGQIANIEDAIDVMFNDIGQSQEGIINMGLDLAGKIVENWRAVGEAIAVAATAYGSYKAVLMAVTAYQTIEAKLLGQIAVEKALAAAAGIQLSDAEAMAAAKTKLLTIAQKGLAAALKRTAAATLANPYVLAAAAITALVYAIYKWVTADSAAEAAQKSLNKTMEDLAKAQQKYNEETEEAIKLAESDTAATADREDAMKLLISRYPEIIQKYIDEEGHLKDILKMKKEIADFDGKQQRKETTEKLRNTGLEAWNLYNELKGYASRQLNAKIGNEGFDSSERERIEKIREAYKEETGKSWYNDVTLSEMRDYYKEKAAKGRKAYNRNLTENKLYDFTAEGGTLESYTDTQLQELKRRLQDAQSERHKNTAVLIEDLDDYLTYDDRADLLTRVNGMIEARSKGKFTSSGHKAELKKAVDEAQKALADFDKSSDKYTANELEKKRKELQDAVDAAEKAYKGFGGEVKTDKQQETADNRRVKAQEELNEKLKTLQQQNTETETGLMEEGTEKKLKAIDDDYSKRIAEIDKQEAEFKKKNKEAGQGGDLTDEQSDALAKARELAGRDRDRQKAEVYRDEIAALNNYLKEYGSFYQKKRAITEDYEARIAKAKTEGERKSLKREMETELASLTYESIAAGIDWKSLFSGVGTLSKDMMQPMMDKLTAFTKTDEYRNADSQTQKDVADLIGELRQYLGSDQSVTWETLGEATNNFEEAVTKYDEAVEAEKKAISSLAEIIKGLKKGENTQEDYDNAKAEADRLGDATAKAKEEMADFADKLNDTSEQVANYTSKLTTALNNLKGFEKVEGFSDVKQSVSNIDEFKGALDSALPSMGEGLGKEIGTELSSVIGDGLSSIGGEVTSALSGIVGFMAQVPRLILDVVSSVKNLVVGVFDSLSNLISLRWIDDLVVSILDAIGNLIDTIFDLPENIAKVIVSIVVDGVGGLLDTVLGRVGNILTLGALSSEGPSAWFTNSNAKKVAETIERLTEENEMLEQAVENLTEEMEKRRGAEAINISRQAVELQKQINENNKEKAQTQAGYHSAHHSWNYYWEGFTDEQIKRLSKLIGRDWNGDIWDLTPEEMKLLQANVDMWEQIKDTGKGGYGERVAEELEDYIDQAGKLEEITDALNETLTTTTAENVFEDFLGSLQDLASGSEDVFDDIADAWQEMVNKMVVNNLVGAKFQKRLESWYEKLAELNETKAAEGSDMTDEAYRAGLEKLKAEYEQYVKDAQTEIESLRDTGIIKTTDEYSQEASDKGYQTMSQDTAEELNGRFTALQISGDAIARQAAEIYGQMVALTSIQSSSNSALLEIRNLMVYNNSYLEDVVKYSKKMYTEFGDSLTSITNKIKSL